MRPIIALLVCLLVAGCGEKYASYDYATNDETEWHRCMRQHTPVRRNACDDLK